MGNETNQSEIPNKIAANIPDPPLKKKGGLSITSIETLLKCGEMFRRRYILKQRSPVTIDMIVGRAVDDSVTLNLDRKMIKDQFMSIEEITDLVLDRYRKAIREARESDEGILLKKKEALAGKEESIIEGEKKAVRLAKIHAIEVAPKLHPIHLQRSLSVELPDHPFDIGGVIDIQEVDAVRDTKTKGKTPPGTVADEDEQLTVYAMLVYLHDGAIPPKLILDCLIDNKTAIYRPFETTRIEEDFDVLLERIAVANYAIQCGVFLPARQSDWFCGEYQCGYWPTCKYVRRKHRPIS